jgi:aquaporin Z
MGSLNKAIVEFIGAFFLIFTIGMTVVAPGVPPGFAPLAIGSALMVMIFAGGHISGGHFNPAVSLAVFLRGKATLNDTITYWVAQILAAIVAGFLVIFMKSFQSPPAPTTLDPAPVPALIGEFLFTFALCWVVLNAATARGTSGNSFYGLAIGFTVLTGAYAVGAVSGGAFNPAVVIGAAVMGLITWSGIWIHLIGNILGAVVAAYAFRFLSPEDMREAAPTAAPPPTSANANTSANDPRRRRR